MDITTFFAIALVMLGIWIFVSLRSARRMVDRRPPTTWKLPLLGHLARLDPKRPFKTVTDWGVNELGPVFRLNFGSDEVIVLNNYDAIREAFVKQSDNFTDRPDMWLFKELQENGKRGISMSEGTCWKEQRRFVLNGLKDAGFASTTMEDIFQDEIDDLIAHCRQQLKTDTVVNINQELRLSVGNVINSILYGFKFDRNDQRFHGFQRKLREVLDLIGMSGLLMTFPCLRHIPFFGYKKLQSIWGEMFAFHTEEIDKCQQRIAEEIRSKQKADHKADFVSSYLREIERRSLMNDTDHHFDLRQLKFIVADVWAGGQDTAATTLLWCILFLLHKPEHQERIYRELRASYDHPPSYRDRAAAPFVQAVIMESQRLGNIVPFAITHGAVADTTLFGYEIKKGAKLLPNLWGTHMDPKYFPEPEKFLPERFLNDDGSLKTRVEGFIPFSMGRRQCMGETFSKICMFKVLTSLIWNFKINFNDRKPRPTLEPRIGMILDPQTYDVELQLRDL